MPFPTNSLGKVDPVEIFAITGIEYSPSLTFGDACIDKGTPPKLGDDG